MDADSSQAPMIGDRVDIDGVLGVVVSRNFLTMEATVDTDAGPRQLPFSAFFDGSIVLYPSGWQIGGPGMDLSRGRS